MKVYDGNVKITFETQEKETIENCIETLYSIIKNMKIYDITNLYNNEDDFINIEEIKEIREELLVLLECNEGS